MAVMVSVPYRSVTAIASPQLSRAIKEQNREECSLLIRQVTRNLLLIGGFILLLIWVNIDLIYHILPNGETYAQAKEVVLILGISQLVMATFSICLTTLNYSKYYAMSLLLSLLLTVSAIILNNHLVPLRGMEGAALSNLLSYAGYFLLIIITVIAFCRVQVVDKRWFLSLLLILALFGANALWQAYVPTMNIWLDSIVRSLVILGGGAWIAYAVKLSPEINEVLH
jgi:O-antigen/teichoic acid export membrane protein